MNEETKNNIIYYSLVTLFMLILVGIGAFLVFGGDNSDPFLDCIERESLWNVVDWKEYTDAEGNYHYGIYVAYMGGDENLWLAFRNCTEQENKEYTTLAVAWVFFSKFVDVNGDIANVGSIYVVWDIPREIVLGIPDERSTIYLSEMREEIETVICNAYECMYVKENPYHLDEVLESNK